MRRIVLLFFCVNVYATIFASDGEYAVSKIPIQLLIHANAVKRLETIRFEVSNLEHARYYKKIVVTVLNEKGDKFGMLSQRYDQLQSVESLDGKLFDASGNKIKSLKRSDVMDESGTDAGTLADDDRYKYHSFYYKVYPYTVEYEVELKYNHTVFFPYWQPLSGDNISLESGGISVSLPEGIDFRYKNFNIKDQPQVVKEKSYTTYTWQLKNQPAVQDEYASPSYYDIVPLVLTGPAQFSIKGYSGNMSSWKDMGRFVYALKAGRDQLPDDVKKMVHQLADGLSEPSKKVEVLYSYLQKNTRYISIQMGIGGWQPFEASYVAKRNYGDCKALVNYMYSLLKEAGIKSNYTLVKSGDYSTTFIEDFPSMGQFDHVILSVPMKQDTIWLECTDQSLPAGYLSGFTSNRPALVVDEEGGKLVRTPKYGLKENQQVRHTTAVLDAEGVLNSKTTATYRGLEQDDIASLITHLSRDKVLDHLKQEIDLPNYDVMNFDYQEHKSSNPFITEDLSITAKDYAQITGKRIFITPNILSRSLAKIPSDTSRKYDIRLQAEYGQTDTVEITVPDGYVAEAMPQNSKIDAPFGKYENSFLFEGNKIRYVRKFEKYSGIFKASEFAKLVDFYNQIYKADRARIVLTKK